MAGYLSFWPDGQIFNWQDKSGSRSDDETRLPFYIWVPSPKITDTSNIPTVAIQETGSAKLSDVFCIGHASVVSERFKDIVEKAEPDVHQFFPVELRRQNGTVFGDSYFIFHPTRTVPCVLLSKSGIRSTVIVKHGQRIGLPNYSVHANKYVISRPAYGERKIFGSLFLGADALFVSDEIMKQLQTEKLTNLMTYPVKELDEPWVFEREAPELAAFLKGKPEISAWYQSYLQTL